MNFPLDSLTETEDLVGPLVLSSFTAQLGVSSLDRNSLSTEFSIAKINRNVTSAPIRSVSKRNKDCTANTMTDRLSNVS